MVAPTVTKLMNKVAWTARRIGRSAPSETLYQEEQGAPRVHQAHSRSSLLSHNTATQSLPTACWWKRPWNRTSRCRGVGVTIACRRERAVADADEPVVFLSEGGPSGAAILNEEGRRGDAQRLSVERSI
jgi:hypothetical protein